MDMILLIFLCWQIGKKAMLKGLKPWPWRLRLILTWLCFEFTGFFLGSSFFNLDFNNKEHLLRLALIALASGFGGYLLVKASLDKIPDEVDREIDEIGDR
ncbi:MAG: hypothetical protein ABI402_16070 [Ferruginibacter sp.]